MVQLFIYQLKRKRNNNDMTKKQAINIIKIRSNEFTIDPRTGMKRIHPKSWSELFMARTVILLSKKK